MRAIHLAMTLPWALAAQVPAPQARDPRLDARVVEAAIKGDLPALEEALAAGGSPNALHPKGESAFHLALLFKQTEAADRLLAAGAAGLNERHDFTGKGKVKGYPLSWAAWTKQEATVRMLLKRGADVNAIGEDGLDALVGAIASEVPGTVEALLEAGADPNRRLSAGHTAMWVAALRGNPAILQLLVAHKGNVDSRDDHGTTPLMAAVEMGHVEAVRLLLKHGAAVYPLDAWEGTALSSARKAKDPLKGQQMTELLIKAGAQEGNPLRTLDSAFLNAVRDGNLEKAKALLAKGADLHARGKIDVETYLPDALSLSIHHPNLFAFLLEAGINPHMRSAYDHTALHLAARSGTPDMIARLVAAGLDVNGKSKPGMVPLYMAINGKPNPRNVAALLRLGANPNATTPMGGPLVDFARERGQTEVVRLLEAAGAKGSPMAVGQPPAVPAPKPPRAARPQPAAPAGIDRFELGGLRLGMAEPDILAKFPTASFTPKGGLRVAKVPLPPDQVPFLPGISEATVELTLVDQHLARVFVHFLPAATAGTEEALLAHLQGPSMDEDHTFTQGNQKLVRRDLTWLGEAHYVTYRRFTRPGKPQSSLMLSLLPRQESKPAYDAMSVNKPAGADVYISQGGAFVPSRRVGGKLVFQLKRAPFQIGGNHEGIRVALAEHPVGEFTLDLDPTLQDRYSSLSGAHCGAVAEETDYLFVSDGRLGCESLSCLNRESYKTVKPMAGYKVAYGFSSLHRLDAGPLPVSAAPAVLHGFLAVTTDRTREDGSHVVLTSPIELVFH